MKQAKGYKLFDDYLRECLKSPEEEKAYYAELIKTRIAVEICEYRNKRGLTQEELAQKIGSTQPSVARMESTSYGQYSLKSLQKIADALDLELVVSFREKHHKEEIKEEVAPENYLFVSTPKCSAFQVGWPLVVPVFPVQEINWSGDVGEGDQRPEIVMDENWTGIKMGRAA